MSFFRSRSSSRSRAGVVLLAFVACVGADVVQARPGPQVRRIAAPRMAPQRAMQRPAPERPPEVRPQPVEPAVQAPAAKPGRLSPDERRALRQQINDAGRDLYRPVRP